MTGAGNSWRRKERTGRIAGHEFRSYRRRFILAIIPFAVFLAGLLAILSARAVRAVATPVIRLSTENFLKLLAWRIQDAPREEIQTILEEFVQPETVAYALVEDGEVVLVAGHCCHLKESLSDAARILEFSTVGTSVHDQGPLGTWMCGVERVGKNRFIVVERRLSGPGTLYFSAAIAVTIAALVVSILFAALLSKVLFRPVALRLEELRSALMRYEAGEHDFRIEIPEGHHDEWDEVNRAFNRMATRIEELEAQRRKQEERKRALLADLAHDVNTPIAVLRGYAETLIDKGDSMDRKDLLDVHSRILGQSFYIQAIVEDLLTMADASEHQLRINPEDIDLDELFDLISDAFQPLASQQNLALIGDARGLHLRADPIRLRQILNNLVRNAVLHARGASLIEMGAAAVDGETMIWVEDDGPGIPEEIVAKLFERRQRGANPGGKGWGLGLAIVRTLAELHGGRVRHVPLSPGARFEVFFPE